MQGCDRATRAADAQTQRSPLEVVIQAECAAWQVLGGADLFLAGVIAPPAGLPHFSTGQLMAVRVLGHPLPFAVGVMECSSAEAAKSGMKGRGESLDAVEHICYSTPQPQTCPCAPCILLDSDEIHYRPLMQG